MTDRKSLITLGLIVTHHFAFDVITQIAGYYSQSPLELEVARANLGLIRIGSHTSWCSDLDVFANRDLTECLKNNDSGY